MTKLRIFEQTLRDGLGSYPPVPPAIKAELTRKLIDANIDYLEVMRFPTAEDRPQFQQAKAILQAVAPYRDQATIAAFAVGEAGINEALRYADSFDELHIPSFASNAYGNFALGEDWAAALRRIQSAFQRCALAGIRLTVGLGTSFGCPIDQSHQPSITASRVHDIVAVGVSTVMLGDTAGQATPNVVRAVLSEIAADCPPNLIRVHFHDTFSRALLNTWQAIQLGVEAVDSSLLGLGGEPYPYFRIPEFVNNGNCATEALVSALADEYGSVGNYSPDKLNDIARWLFQHIQGTVYGRASFADLVPVPAEENDEVPQRADRH